MAGWSHCFWFFGKAQHFGGCMFWRKSVRLLEESSQWGKGEENGVPQSSIKAYLLWAKGFY